MMLTLDLDFFQMVYLKTDPQQLPRLVVSVEFNASLVPLYGLACGMAFSKHYLEEIATEKDTVAVL